MRSWWRKPGSADERIVRRAALRIAVQTVAAVAITVLALVVIALGVMLRSQHTAQSALIDAAISRADDVSDPPAGSWLVVRRDGHESATPGLPKGLPDRDQLERVARTGQESATDLHMRGREYRVVTRVVPGVGVVQVAVDLAPDHAARDRLVTSLLAAGLAGLVMAAIAGAWLARRAVAPMARALALQRRFVADASHELRTPLTLLSTRAQLIRRGLAGTPASATLSADADSLVTDAATLARILDDLLFEIDPRVAQPDEPVDLRELTESVAAAMAPLAARRPVTIEVIGDAVWARGSTAALRRALTALLDNAVRHATARVTVRLSLVGARVVIEVADDGPGIDPAVMPMLFERFAPTPADGVRGGTRRYGIGLSLVSEIAARHGGRITAANGESGAVFRLELPAAKNLPRTSGQGG